MDTRCRQKCGERCLHEARIFACEGEGEKMQKREFRLQDYMIIETGGELFWRQYSERGDGVYFTSGSVMRLPEHVCLMDFGEPIKDGRFSIIEQAKKHIDGLPPWTATKYFCRYQRPTATVRNCETGEMKTELTPREMGFDESEEHELIE